MPVAETFSNAGPAIARWVRRHTTADALMDGLKTAVWVVPLTILIWLYAEQEKPSNKQDQQIQISFHSATPDRVITLLGRSDDQIIVDLDGSKAAVDAVLKELNKPGENPTVRIEVSADLAEGKTKIPISDQVVNAEIFKRNHVEVKKVLPPVIEVQIDSLITRDVEVKADPKAPIAGTPTFVPPTIKVTGPRKDLEGAQLVAYAQIPPEFLIPSSYPEKTLTVLPPISGEHVTISPTTVKATFQIKAEDVQYEIKSLNLRYSFTPAGYQDRIVESTPVVYNVNVYGPLDQINKIKSGEFPTYATLKIDPDDPVNETTISRALEYNVPPGVEVNKADKERLFDFKLKKPTTPAG